jgi:hypothetical protein
VAVGSYADKSGHDQAMIVTEARGRWGRAAELRLPRNAAANPEAELNDVGCPSGTCVAVGSYQTGPSTGQAMAVIESKGTWGRATEISLPASAGKKQDAFLAHITCSSPRSCLAVGGYATKSGASAALAVTLSKGKWQRAIEVAGPRHARSAGLYSVSCSATSCLAVGSYQDASRANHGLAVLESHGKWGSAMQVSAPSGAASGAEHYTVLYAVACGPAHRPRAQVRGRVRLTAARTRKAWLGSAWISTAWHYRQQQRGWRPGAVDDLDVNCGQARRRGHRFTGAGVAREPRMRAAGDLQPQPVARFEPVRRRAHGHGHLGPAVRVVSAGAVPGGVIPGDAVAAGGQMPEQAVADVLRMSPRIDITQPGEYIEIRAAAANPQPGADRADDFERFRERCAGEDQDVGAGLQGVVAPGTGVP